jgi:hypothetical protein
MGAQKIMAEFEKRKINIKIFDPPLTGNQLTKYCDVKGVRIPYSSDEFSLFGEALLEDKLFGTLVVSKEIWSDDVNKGPNYDLLDRLVIKLLERSGAVMGTIEERLLKEFTLSSATPLFSIILKSSPLIIDFDLDSDKLSFPFLTESGKGLFNIFQISKKIGNNFQIKKKIIDRKIASIDTKRGGKIEIKIEDEDLANNEEFFAILILFAGTAKFHDEITSKLRHGFKSLSEGTFVLRPPETELNLMAISEIVEKPAKKRRERLKVVKEAEVQKREKAPEIEVKKEIEALQKTAKKAEKEVEEIPTKELILEKSAPKALKPEPMKKEEIKIPPKIKVVEPIKKVEVKEPPPKLVEDQPVKKVEVKEPPPKTVVPAPVEEFPPELVLPAPPKRPVIEEPVKKIEPPSKPVEPEKPEKSAEYLKPLSLEANIIEIQGITEKIRILLENIGIDIVDDLLFMDPEVLAERIGHKDVTATKIKEWQDSAEKRVRATPKKE